ncbi:hypothetical protein BD626DRAFT_406927 [Schizophyllum amplum]|uniref:Protein kinase domain-containing protein n=1 Tax=Schizophyllum amplum TaxID=97359 RepID=A0A550C7P3_9AGAR|nr:hypothetical protein BD626DRAFT_406927 [Auriculariopsis ampla]
MRAAGTPLAWKYVLAAAQVKSQASAIAETARQLRDGAYNCFATQDDLMWHIEVGLVRDQFWVSIFDRSGCVQSLRANIDIHASYLVRVIVGLALFDRSRLGYDPSLKSLPSGGRTIAVKDIEYQVIKTLFISDVLRGRGTVCWRCRTLDAGLDEEEDVVVKSLWADQSRAHKEAEFLQAAADIEGIITLVAEETVMEGDNPRSTATIRQALQDHDRAHELDDIEVRHHHRLVLKPFGLHLEYFTSKKELLSVLKDCVEAHEKLVYEKHILHSDISDNNVMIRAKGTKDGLRRGLLIDLDYASFIGEKRDRTAIAHRTGTLPFMAHEILRMGDEIPHEPHHDLESFLYVLIWTCVCFAGPNCLYRQNFDITKTRIGRWLDLDARMDDVGAAKEKIMCAPADGTDDKFPGFLDEVCDPYFEDLKPCMCELRDVILGEVPANPREMHVNVSEILQRHIDKLSHPDAPITAKSNTSTGGPSRKAPRRRKATGQTDSEALTTDGELLHTELDDEEVAQMKRLRLIQAEKKRRKPAVAPKKIPVPAAPTLPPAVSAPVAGPSQLLRRARGTERSDAAIVGRLRTSEQAGVRDTYNEDALERERERRQGVPANYRLSSSGQATKRRKLD